MNSFGFGQINLQPEKEANLLRTEKKSLRRSGSLMKNRLCHRPTNSFFFSVPPTLNPLMFEIKKEQKGINWITLKYPSTRYQTKAFAEKSVINNITFPTTIEVFDPLNIYIYI